MGEVQVQCSITGVSAIIHPETIKCLKKLEDNFHILSHCGLCIIKLQMSSQPHTMINKLFKHLISQRKPDGNVTLVLSLLSFSQTWWKPTSQSVLLSYLILKCGPLGGRPYIIRCYKTKKSSAHHNHTLEKKTSHRLNWMLYIIKCNILILSNTVTT